MPARFETNRATRARRGTEPQNYTGSQVVWMHGSDQDCESVALETALPEVTAEQPEAIILPWCGRGNVIAAVGVALLDMVGA